MIKSSLQKQNILENKWFIYSIASIILSIPIFLTAQLTPLQVDDMLLANMSKDGPLSFLVWQFWHYNCMNGRGIIHLLASIFWWMGGWSFGIIPITTTIASGLCFKLFLNTKKEISVLLGSIVTVCMMSFDTKYVAQTFFWGAGAFNYIVPLLFVSITIYVSEKFAHKKKTLALLILLCSMLHEQTTIFMGLYLLFKLAQNIKMNSSTQNKKGIFRHIMHIVLCGAGGLTILLAPPTWKRFTIARQSTTPETLSTPIKSLITNYKEASLYIVLMAIVLTIILLCYKRTRKIGILGACVVASFVPIAYMSTIELRMLTMAIFYIAIVLVSIVYKVIIFLLENKQKKTFHKIAVILLSITMLIGIIAGNTVLFIKRQPINIYAKELHEQFLASSQTKEVIINAENTSPFVFSNKQIMRYRWVFDGTSGDVVPVMKQLYDVPDDVVIKWQSQKEKLFSIQIDGKYSYYPAQQNEEEWYIPLGAVYGTFKEPKIIYDSLWWTSHFMIKDDKMYFINLNSKLLSVIDINKNETLKEVPFNPLSEATIDTTYIKIKDFCEFYNLDYTINEEQNVICMTSKEQ